MFKTVRLNRHGDTDIVVELINDLSSTWLNDNDNKVPLASEIALSKVLTYSLDRNGNNNDYIAASSVCS